MKFFRLLISATSLWLASAFAQSTSPAEQELIAYQQKIDDAVVAADVAWLQNAYTDDFYFKHGTGNVDNRASWLTSVKKNRGGFLARTHSDVQVDLHGDIGITHGKLRVVRKDQGYLLDYVRVYVRRDGRWQLLSHCTVQQEPLNPPPRINEFALCVSDLKTSTAFYMTVIGLTPIPEPYQDGHHSWVSAGSNTRLHLTSGATVERSKEKNPRLGFTVSSVDAFVPRLTAAGIAYETRADEQSAGAARGDGVKQIYFQDPDGYWIEITDARE